MQHKSESLVWYKDVYALYSDLSWIRHWYSTATSTSHYWRSLSPVSGYPDHDMSRPSGCAGHQAAGHPRVGLRSSSMLDQYSCGTNDLINAWKNQDKFVYSISLAKNQDKFIYSIWWAKIMTVQVQESCRSCVRFHWPCGLIKTLVAKLDLFDSVGKNHDETRFKNHIVAHVCVIASHNDNSLFVGNSPTDVLK